MPIVSTARTTSRALLDSSVAFDASNPPAHLQGLLALNPKLARDLVSDPGLRAFLELNKAKLVAPSSASSAPSSGAGAALRDDVTLDTWCHATTIVPESERDEEYIVVVARGSAYPTTGDIEIPLDSGGTGSSDGRILYVGKTKDLLASFVPDNDPHYPGAGAVSIDLPVFGNRGETVELTYCRIKPDAQGRASPRRSAWPDSFQGVFGGYAGRDQQLTIRGGARTHLKCPD